VEQFADNFAADLWLRTV